MGSVNLRELAVERGGPQRRARRHLLTRYVLPALLLIGFAALAVWAAWEYLFPPTGVRVIPVMATRAEVQQEGTPLFKAAGWIEPRPTAVRAAALAPGVVERLLVVEDQPVEAGEPIAELVKDDARLALARAEAMVKLREAELGEAKAKLAAAQTRLDQPVHLEASLSEAEMALAQTETQLRNLPHETRRAEARLELARADFQGKKNSQGAVSGLAVAQAQSELEAAEALVAELKDRHGSLENERRANLARRDALKTQLKLLADEIRDRDEAKAGVEAAAAQLEQARVEVAEAQLRLDRMTVRSPIGGRIYRLVGYPGTTLTGGMGLSDQFDGSTVVTLYRPEMLQARVDVRFEDMPHVSLGQPVQIENPALKKPLVGKVLFVSSLANIQKNTLEVKVAIDEPPPVFKPEMLVNVTFLAPPSVGGEAAPSEEMRLYLPQEHVHRDETGAFVWLADQSAGMARRTPVQAAAAAPNGLVEIRAGLNVSGRVIATGHEGLKDGQRIRVLGELMETGSTAHAAAGERAPLERLPQGESH